MAAEEHTVKIKTTADLSGTDKAAQGLDNVEKKANRSIKSMVGGFSDLNRASERFNQIVHKIIGFGFVLNGLESAINLFGKLTERTAKAREEAERLKKAEEEAADAKRVEKLAKAYEKLKAEIAGAAKARERANEIDDMQRSAADKLEDDTAELNMREEVAALDENDPLYDRKKDRITSRYETEKLRRSVARQQRDANISAERTWQERDATIEESTEKQFSLISDREELERLKRERDKKYNESKKLNEKDNNTFLQRFKSNMKAVVRLDPSSYGKATSEEGDAVRKQARDEYLALEEKVKALKESISAKEKDIADIDKTAAHLSKKAGIQGDIAVNAGIAVESAAVSSATTNKASDKALADQQAMMADAEAARRALTKQKADIKAKIAAEQAKKDEAGRAVYEAQGNLDMAKLGTGGRDVRPYHAALQEAKDAAQEVDHAADTAINALTKALNSVNERLKRAQSYLESQSKQTRSFMEETPAGE